MKTKIIFIFLLILSTGLDCLAKGPKEVGRPFAQRKANGADYTPSETGKTVCRDSILLKEYCNLFQEIADKQGWSSFLQNGKMTLNNTADLSGRLVVDTLSFEKGDLVISAVKGKKGEEEIIHFSRASYSNWKKKIRGPEQVGQLDVSKWFGWTDANGNPFPRTTVVLMGCLNAAYDTRYEILPISPLVKVPNSDSVVTQNTTNTYLPDDFVPQEHNGQQGYYRHGCFCSCQYDNDCGLWYYPTSTCVLSFIPFPMFCGYSYGCQSNYQSYGYSVNNTVIVNNNNTNNYYNYYGNKHNGHGWHDNGGPVGADGNGNNGGPGGGSPGNGGGIPGGADGNPAARAITNQTNGQWGRTNPNDGGGTKKVGTTVVPVTKTSTTKPTSPTYQKVVAAKSVAPASKIAEKQTTPAKVNQNQVKAVVPTNNARTTVAQKPAPVQNVNVKGVNSNFGKFYNKTSDPKPTQYAQNSVNRSSNQQVSSPPNRQSQNQTYQVQRQTGQPSNNGSTRTSYSAPARSSGSSYTAPQRSSGPSTYTAPQRSSGGSFQKIK